MEDWKIFLYYLMGGKNKFLILKSGEGKADLANIIPGHSLIGLESVREVQN